jgi:DNA-binding LacI/PurR family transcriptional regulator
MLKKPRYASIKEELKQRIESGEFKPHDKLYTQSELIAVYETGITTAVRVLNELAFEGYVYRVNGKGTYVAERETKIRKLCVSVPHLLKDPSSMGYPLSSSILLDHLYRECDKKNWVLQLHMGDVSPQERKASLLRSIKEVDAVVLCQSLQPSIEAEIAVLKESGIPFVVLDTYLEDADIHIVSMDHYRGAYDLTLKLHEKKAETIFFVGRSELTADASMMARRKGYLDAVNQLGLSPRLLLHSNQAELLKSELDGIVDTIAAVAGAKGILCDHFGYAQKLCNRMVEMGMKPDGLQLAVFSNYDLQMEDSVVPVYKCSQPYPQMAKACIEQLMASVASGKPHSVQLLRGVVSESETQSD